MPLRAVIVDDEELARKRLRRLLKRHEAEVNIIGEAANGQDAVDIITETRPDVIFLDVQMPDMSGFDVVRRLEVKPFIVFATAYDQYALQAFEENSVDYLLKPIEQKRLEKTLEKIRGLSGHTPRQLDENLERFLAQLARETLRRIKVQVGDKIYLIDIGDVTYFEAREKYTYLHTIEKEFLVEATLAELEGKLDPSAFIRIHRAYIVNVRHIREIVRWFAGRYKLRLADKASTELIVSRGYSERIRNL